MEPAVQKAVALATGQANEDEMSAPTFQALLELGKKYVAVTTDPKKPAPASDQLVLEIILAYAKALTEGKAGWLLLGYPSTILQAKLLEKQLTGATDQEVEDYLQSLTGKTVKKKTPAKGAPEPPPRPQVELIWRSVSLHRMKTLRMMYWVSMKNAPLGLWVTS